jgi:hypothetical protein
MSDEERTRENQCRLKKGSFTASTTTLLRCLLEPIPRPVSLLVPEWQEMNGSLGYRIWYCRI